MSEDENNDKTLLDEMFETADQAAFGPHRPDQDGPRDPAWLRWAKFVSIIVVAALVVGVCFALVDYTMQFSSNWHDRSLAERRIQSDTWDAMRTRFWFGTCIGGGFGVTYVIKCLFKNLEP